LLLSGAATTATGNAQGNVITGEDNGVAYHLDGGAGNDLVTGANGDDFLSGGAGDDFLLGNGGADQMAGGAGNDIYVLDSAADQVIEAKGGGTDTIVAGFSYDLALHDPNVENLAFSGVDNVDGSGTALNNRIDGNVAGNILNGRDGNDQLLGHDGNDTLNGGNGADLLEGGRGSDTLTGGAGKDVFAFAIDSKADLANLGSDVIADFKSGEDKLDLRDLFTDFGLGHGGNPVNDGHLILTANGDDTLVQFDADGAGGAAPVTLATVIGVHVGVGDILH
jgi:Ca2+-binding RTX toxin-like protein